MSRDVKVTLRKYYGLTPLYLFTNQNDSNTSGTVNFGRPHVKYTFWSYIFRRSIRTISHASSLAGTIHACFSGSGKFIWKDRMLFDYSSTLHLLTLDVIDANGNMLYMISDIFDSPKCPNKYRAMRKHWRQGMHELLTTDIKMVKVSHSFLQKFKTQYNYVPSSTEIESLKYEILDLAKSSLGH